jgi:hypothetical protein
MTLATVRYSFKNNPNQEIDYAQRFCIGELESNNSTLTDLSNNAPQLNPTDSLIAFSIGVSTQFSA